MGDEVLGRRPRLWNVDEGLGSLADCFLTWARGHVQMFDPSSETEHMFDPVGPEAVIRARGVAYEGRLRVRRLWVSA